MGCGASVGLVEAASFYSQFTLLKRIGQGSYGKVYLCQDRVTNDAFAVKAQASRQGKEGLILQEASMWKALGSHPNVIRFYNLRQEVNVYFMIMEICPQGLFDRVTQQPTWTAAELMHDFRQSLNGLAHMHGRRIVHRDIKVQNFLYGGNRTLKIADFGLSEKIPPGRLLESVCGSAAFMAPEMVGKQGYEFKIDMWALGVTFFMMMYGALLVGKTKMTIAEMKEAINHPDATKSAMARATLKAESSAEDVRDLKLAALDVIRQLTIRDPKLRPDANQAMRLRFLTMEMCANPTEQEQLNTVLLVDRAPSEPKKKKEDILQIAVAGALDPPKIPVAKPAEGPNKMIAVLPGDNPAGPAVSPSQKTPRMADVKKRVESKSGCIQSSNPGVVSRAGSGGSAGSGSKAASSGDVKRAQTNQSNASNDLRLGSEGGALKHQASGFSDASYGIGASNPLLGAVRSSSSSSVRLSSSCTPLAFQGGSSSSSGVLQFDQSQQTPGTGFSDAGIVSSILVDAPQAKGPEPRNDSQPDSPDSVSNPSHSSQSGPHGNGTVGRPPPSGGANDEISQDPPGKDEAVSGDKEDKAPENAPPPPPGQVE